MLGDIDFSKKPQKPRLFLAKSEDSIIAILSDAHDINFNRKLNQLDELTFNVYYYGSENNQEVRSRHVDLLRENYLIKFVLGDYSKWFQIATVKECMTDNEDYKQISAFELPYELSFRNIRSYEAISKGAIFVLNEILSGTRWTIGDIDPDFELSKRTFEFQDNTRLDCVNKIAETYNALVVWDTTNLTVSMRKPQDRGSYKGLTFSDGNLLIGFEQESDTKEQITHLRAEGKDGLTLSEVTPNGSTELVDYSYYMFPFERDEDRNVIRKSTYLSDDLCHALLDYKQLIEDNENSFSELRTERNTYSSLISTKTSELTTLKTELLVIEQIENNQLTNNNNPVMFIDPIQYSGSTQTRNFSSLQTMFSYAVMCRVVNTSNVEVRLNGVLRPLLANTWTVLGKVNNVTGVSVQVSGTGTSDVYLQVVNISLSEYDTAGNEAALINRYIAGYKRMQIDAKQAEIDTETINLNAVINLINNLKTLLSENENFTEPQMLELQRFIREKTFKDDKYINAEDLHEAAKEKFIGYRTPQLSMKVDVVDFLQVIEEQGRWDKLVLGDEIRVLYDRIGVKVKARIIEINYDFDSYDINLTIASVTSLDNEEMKLKDYLQQTTNSSTMLSANASKWTQAIVDTSDMSQMFDLFRDKQTGQIRMKLNNDVDISHLGIIITDPTDPLRFIQLNSGGLLATKSGGNEFETCITADGIISEYLYGKIVLSQRVTVGDADGVWLMEGPKTTITDRCGREAMKIGLIEESPDMFGIVVNRYNNDTPCSTNMLNRILLNSEDGIKIQQWNGLEFRDKFMVDNQGFLYSEDMTTKRLRILSDTDELLLDSFTKYMDIGKFENIITDGKLTALEKLQVRGERTRIISEYAKLLDQANLYKETTRDSSIRIDTTDFTDTYNALIDYLEPLLEDMDATSDINRDEYIGVFKAYYDEVVNIINAVNDSIKYSSVQFGSSFNNVLLDYMNGVVVTRSDIMYRSLMNATKGFAIQKNTGTSESPIWTDQFYADLNGIITANGININGSFFINGAIEGSSLTLRDGLDGVMKMFPSVGFHAGAENFVDAPASIGMDGTATFRKLIVTNGDGGLMIDSENKFIDMSMWDLKGASVIYSELINATIVAGDFGFISDLTAGRLSTLTNAATSGWSNYLTAEGNALKFITGRVSGTGTHAELPDGRKLYWVNSSQTGQMTTDETAYPVYDYPMENKVKLLIDHKGVGDDAYPRIAWGLGDGVVSDPSIGDGMNNYKSGRAFMEKPVGSFDTVYWSANTAKERSISLRNDGIYLYSEDERISQIARTFQFGITDGGSFSVQHTNGSKLIFNANGTVDFESAGAMNLKAGGAMNLQATQYNFN